LLSLGAKIAKTTPDTIKSNGLIRKYFGEFEDSRKIEVIFGSELSPKTPK